MSVEQVLVMDDEETLRFVLQSVVQALGCEALVASTKAQALEYLVRRRPGVALLDLIVPDGNGVEVLEEIKRTSPDTEVIMLTGHASVETAIASVRAGAYDYIEKPFEIDALSALVKRALEKRALVVSNQRLLADLELQNVRLEAMVRRAKSLAAAGNAMSQIRELSELLEFFIRLLVEELGVDRASVMLLDGSGELRIAASHGIDQAIVGTTRVRVGEGIVGRVVETGAPILASDVRRDRGNLEAARDDLSDSFLSVPIELSVPIKSDSRILGAINVTNRRSGMPFNQEDLDFLSGLGGQAAVAIERARHWESLTQAIESLEEARCQLETSNARLREANERLEDAARLKDEFIANTSHELRTPLSGVVGSLHIVLDELCRTPEEERMFLDQAMSSALKLTGLIDDLLTISKIEGATLSLTTERVAIAALFDSVRQATERTVAAKGLSIQFEVEAPCEWVRADLGKTKQVLLNLIGNSIKFTAQGGITVRAREQPGRGHVWFEVVDSGIGIREDDARRLFQPFTQVDGSATRKYGGTGLGLAISRGLVERMGGIIDIAGLQNAGTQVHFSLPVWSQDTEAADPGRVSARIEGPTGTPLVMIVEDDPVLRRFMVRALTSHGYRAVQAGDAATAWMLLRRLRPSLALIDYALSDSGVADLRSGWELAQHIGRDPETATTPIVFATGFDSEIRARMSREASAPKAGVLAKPFELDELLKHVEKGLATCSEPPQRILLADSDSKTIALFRSSLPASRYFLEAAVTGEECLDALRAQPRGFDLLLIELAMLEAFGYDMIRQIGGIDTDSPIRIVVLAPDHVAGKRLEAVRGDVFAIVERASLGVADSIQKLVARYGPGASDSEARAGDDPRKAA